MRLYKSKTWNLDLRETIDLFPAINAFAGKKIMVTGACGLICSTIIDLLIYYNETHSEAVHIYAASRSEKRVNERFAEYSKKDYFHFIQYNAESDDFGCLDSIDFIIHGASNATPDTIMREPVETMMANILGLYNLLKLGRSLNVKRVLYISSSEVYGKRDNVHGFSESEYGYIDLLNERNSYSVSKRASETLAISYAREYGVDTVIVRPGHVYGPTATEVDNRVSSAWAHAAAKGKTITMKSAGLQIRSYCHCLDCATAILFVLLYGKNETAYNIANRDSEVSICDMAKYYAAAANTVVTYTEPSESEKRAFNPMNNSTLNSEQLYALGWKGRFDPKSGFSETIEVLKEIQE